MIENNGTMNLDFQAIKNLGYNNAAKIFSEDDNLLAQILEKLWNNNQFTFACCKGRSEKGHRTGLQKQPYVSILIDEENKQEVFKLIKYILSSKNKFKPDITFSTTMLNNKYRTSVLLDRTFLTNGPCDKMFNEILNSLNNYKFADNINLSDKTNEILALCSKLIFGVVTPPYSDLSLKISHNNPSNITLVVRLGDKNINFHKKNIESIRNFIYDNTISIKEANRCGIHRLDVVKPTGTKRELNSIETKIGSNNKQKPKLENIIITPSEPTNS